MWKQTARRWREFIRKDLVPTTVDALVYLVVRVIICVIQSLTPAACLRVAHFFAYVFCDVLRIRHQVVDENLRHAMPELSEVQRAHVTKQMWEHLFTMICEIALAGRKIHQSNWRDYIEIGSHRRIVRAFLDRRALVAVTAHLGNFEMCGYVSGLLGFPTYTIARPLDNKFLHNFLMRFRGTTGQFVLSTQGSGQQALDVIDSGETLALLGDHYGGKKGCWVDFLNRPASCHKAISVFSLAHRVPMAVVYMERVGDFLKFRMPCTDIYDPQASQESPSIVDLTQWYNRQIESAVRTIPDQYWWLHRRWKDPRSTIRRRAAA